MPTDPKMLATWSLLMVGTALRAGISEKDIRHAMRPANLTAAINLCQKKKEASNAG